LGADEVSAQSWQLITAIHDETDGLMLCKQLSQGYGSTLCHVTFKLLLRRFLFNFIYIYIYIPCEVSVLPALLERLGSAEDHRHLSVRELLESGLGLKM